MSRSGASNSPGQVFTTHIQRQLDAARCIVVLWSKASVTSQFVSEEAREGATDRTGSRTHRTRQAAARVPRTSNGESQRLAHGRNRRRVRPVGAISAIVPP